MKQTTHKKYDYTSFVYSSIVAFFVFCTVSIEARIIEVCSQCELKTVKSAITKAKSGDEVVLKKGTYLEHDIEISKSLTLRGEEGVIIDGENAGTILTIMADNVLISNLTIINVGHSYTQDFTGILIKNSKNYIIKNNNLQKVFFGIKIERSDHGILIGNSVSSESVGESGSGNGIHAWHSSDIRVENNDLHNMRDGIYFEFIDNSIVVNNVSHNNIRYGLHFMFSNNNSYENNDFYENGAGVAVMFSKFTVMKNNIFRNNWGTASYGLLLKEIYDADIINNKFTKNTVAINIEGSTRVNYYDNTFQENGWAIKVTGACYKNIYKKNNFFGNAMDVSYHSKMNDNEFEGNYWSSYTGYDLNRDGVGDVPFRPVKLFSFIVNQHPEAIVLLRSLFVDLIDFSEKVSPIFTPEHVIDNKPAMREY